MSQQASQNLSPEEELRALSHKYDELLDRLDVERKEHEITKGYRQLAEQDREHLRGLIGSVGDLPEGPPTFAPEGYAVELNRVVEILLKHANPTEGKTVSEVVAEIAVEAMSWRMRGLSP